MSEKVRVYIVEDEGVTRATLEDHLEQMGYELAGWADNAADALAEMLKTPIDLAILDINLQGTRNGIWLAEQLAESNAFPFIFLTAYGDAETVAKAAATNPYGYLLKPFQSNDVFAAIAIALKNFSNAQAAVASATPAPEPEPENLLVRDTVYIRDDYQFVKLRLTDILYVQAANNYLEIVLPGKKHLLRKPMKDIVAILPTDTFCQVHRSYIVNTTVIDSFGAGYLHIGGTEIPISQSYRDSFQERFTTL